MIYVLFNLQWCRAILSWSNNIDLTTLVKCHLVDAYLTVSARAELTLAVVRIDAMVNNIPLILAIHLKNRVVGSAIDLVLWILLKDNRFVSNGNWTERAC